jgi:glycosyltransferase involved in cell wall biosynthesis
MRHGRLRVVFTEQGRLSDTPPSTKRWLVNQFLGRLPASIFAVSADLRRHMIAEGFPPGRVGVIYNAIDGGSVPAESDRERMRRELGLRPEALLIGTAARLDPVKDLPTLVEALARLRAKVPAAELVIIGEGPDRGRIEDRIRQHGLEAVVHCLGYRSDVRQLLAGLDIYVNCSVSEGISLTILEAMASALPVVATKVGGNPEVVAEGETGLLVPARSAEPLAAALTTFALAPGQRRSFGAAGRRRMEAVFAVDGMVEKYVRAYRGDAAPCGST